MNEQWSEYLIVNSFAYLKTRYPNDCQRWVVFLNHEEDKPVLFISVVKYVLFGQNWNLNQLKDGIFSSVSLT